MTHQTSTVWQPIHPDVLDRLLPEYVEVHNRTTAYLRPIQDLPWDPECRKAAPVAGGSDPLQVATIQDFRLSKCQVRVFTPEGDVPAEGWPVLLYFHGGKYAASVR